MEKKNNKETNKPNREYSAFSFVEKFIRCYFYQTWPTSCETFNFELSYLVVGAKPKYKLVVCAFIRKF